MEHIAVPSWAALAYLASGVLFVLALRGLSSPASSRTGNRFGMIGMTIAVLTTLLLKAPVPEGGFLPQPTPDDLVIFPRSSRRSRLAAGSGGLSPERSR